MSARSYRRPRSCRTPSSLEARGWVWESSRPPCALGLGVWASLALGCCRCSCSGCSGSCHPGCALRCPLCRLLQPPSPGVLPALARAPLPRLSSRAGGCSRQKEAGKSPSCLCLPPSLSLPVSGLHLAAGQGVLGKWDRNQFWDLVLRLLHGEGTPKEANDCQAQPQPSVPH